MNTKIKAKPHKARLTALHEICLHIFRHLAQKSLDIRQYACELSIQSDEKSVCASFAQALCSVALVNRLKRFSHINFFKLYFHKEIYNEVEKQSQNRAVEKALLKDNSAEINDIDFNLRHNEAVERNADSNTCKDTKKSKGNILAENISGSLTSEESKHLNSGDFTYSLRNIDIGQIVYDDKSKSRRTDNNEKHNIVKAAHHIGHTVAGISKLLNGNNTVNAVYCGTLTVYILTVIEIYERLVGS